MKFHHVAITVKDLSISIPFYGNFFGLKEIKRFRRDDMGATGCFFQLKFTNHQKCKNHYGFISKNN